MELVSGYELYEAISVMLSVSYIHAGTYITLGRTFHSNKLKNSSQWNCYVLRNSTKRVCLTQIPPHLQCYKKKWQDREAFHSCEYHCLQLVSEQTIVIFSSM